MPIKKYKERTYILPYALSTDPEAYYYARRTLKGAREAGRVENRTKRFGNETERFGDRTKRFRNVTLCIFVKRKLCFSFPLIYRFPRMANRLFIYHRYGKIRLSVNLI